MTPLRCAIYTRKSSEEGLDQAFNSLDAQREACAAYVQSQRHEGWRLLPTPYDDGGYSGGTLERPALQKLLAEVTAGTVDLIVVYKVDRLTRSLSDFAKIVDQLDARNVSFVSVTQSFNTTTSMGRLTLNVLLSFAQFEREVTGERIRDKIAASKRKGMWMGGLVPLGYDVIDRKLVVNEAEAKIVRHIYAQYLEHGAVSRLREVLAHHGVRSKCRTDRDGRPCGNNKLTSGALFAILTNPIYRGQIAHRGLCHAGQHEAIVPEALWTQAQALRERTRRANSTLPRAQARNPLLGLLTDAMGGVYQAVHTTKGHRRYRYYVTKEKPTHQHPRQRLPADELENHVVDRIRTFFATPKAVADAVVPPDAQTHQRVIAESKSLATVDARMWELYRPLVKQVELRAEEIAIHLDRLRLRQALGIDEAEASDKEPSPTVLVHPIRLRRTAHELRLIVSSGGAEDEAAKPNPSLIRFLARGRRWYRQLTSGEMPSIKAIATTENVTERYVARVLRGSLLAPELIDRILAGRQPVTLTVRKLLGPPPIDWAEQSQHFGFSG